MNIRGLGMRENELAKLMVQMDDWEKLTTVRTSLKDGDLKSQRLHVLCSESLVGVNLEQQVAHLLGMPVTSKKPLGSAKNIGQAKH